MERWATTIAQDGKTMPQTAEMDGGIVADVGGGQVRSEGRERERDSREAGESGVERGPKCSINSWCLGLG